MFGLGTPTTAKTKKQHFYKHVQFIYPPSACKEVSALSTRDTIKKELEKEDCKIVFGKISLGKLPKSEALKWWRMGGTLEVR